MADNDRAPQADGAGSAGCGTVSRRMAGLAPLPPGDGLAGQVAAFACECGVTVVWAGLVGARAWGLPAGAPAAEVGDPGAGNPGVLREDPATLALAILYRSPDAALLGLIEPPDVIDQPGDGRDRPPLIAWEARRACRLLLRSNARVWEWLASPHPVGRPGAGVADLVAFAEQALAPAPLADHALATAKAAMTAFFPGPPLVAARLKYAQVCRALLTLRWILERGTAPPPDWDRLRDALVLPPEVDQDLAVLEADRLTTRRMEGVDAWIDASFAAARTWAGTAAGHREAAARGHPDARRLETLYRALGPTDGGG